MYQIAVSKNMKSCRSPSCFECPPAVCKHYHLRDIASRPSKIRVKDAYSSYEDEKIDEDDQVAEGEELWIIENFSLADAEASGSAS